jgi:hypothetical protein
VSAACARPIAPAALVEYWLGDDAATPVDAVEEHLMECDSCGGRLRGLWALGEGVRRLAREGVVAMIVTPSFLSHAAREGLRTREYRVPPGGRVDCTVTAQDDLLVGRLLADFSGVSRLDLVTSREGLPEHRIPDVPISPDATELIVAQSMPLMRTLGRSRFVMRLLSREREGERLVGEYTFDHFASG